MSDERRPFGEGCIEHLRRRIALAEGTGREGLIAAVELLRQHDHVLRMLDKHRCNYALCRKLATHVDATDHPAKWYCDVHADLGDSELPWAEQLRCLEDIAQGEKGR